MRAVLIDVSETYLAQRQKQGLNRFDERWEGEWHFVNPPRSWHAVLSAALLRVLAPLAEVRGLLPTGDSLGIFRASDDWRIPDQAFLRPDDLTDAGANRAELVVELRSPNDESYAKLPFYAAVGVSEVLIVQRNRSVELFRRRGDGEFALVENAGGTVVSHVLGCSFEVVDSAAGSRLCINWDDGTADV